MSDSELFFLGLGIGAGLGLLIGVLLAWVVLKTKANRQIHQQVVEMTKTVTSLFEQFVRRKEPKKTDEEKLNT